MSRLLIILIASMISGNIMFIILLRLKEKVITYSADFYYILLRASLLYYILSSAVVAIFFLYTYASYKIVFIQQPDIEFITITATQFTSKSLIYQYLIIIWLMGTLYYLIKNCIAEKLFYKTIIAASKTIVTTQILDLKEELVREMKITKKIPLLYCPFQTSPLTMGVRHPIIILNDIYEPEEYEFILKHELMHIKSKDILYKKLLIWFRAMQWFNPMFPKFITNFFECIELACDEKILLCEGGRRRLKYAQLMLKIFKNKRTEYHVLTAGFAKENISGLNRRIDNIMKMSSKKMSKLLAGILSLSIIAVCPVTVYASTIGIAYANNAYTKLYSKNSDIVEDLQIATESYEQIPLENFETMREVSLRGTNSIDQNLLKEKSIKAKVTIPNDVSTLVVDFSSDNSSDKFSVAVYDSSGRGVKVNSSRGSLTHRFDVKPGASYTVVITNNSSTTIHISGKIYL